MEKGCGENRGLAVDRVEVGQLDETARKVSQEVVSLHLAVANNYTRPQP